MKKITLLLAIVSGSLGMSHASIKTSVQDGVWTDPAIWVPTGIPTLLDDTIIINTAVSYSHNISFGRNLFRITAFGSLASVTTDTFRFNGTDLVIQGYFSPSFLILDGFDTVMNSGAIAADNVDQRGWLNNQAGATFCAYAQLLSSGIILNNGDISCGSWNHSGTVTGSGKFCISGDFMNTGQISGTMDICDASPGQPGDMNAGTIGGSITYCQVGPCAQCVISSIVEYGNESSVQIIPHPVADVSLMRFTSLGAYGGRYELIVTDVSGRIVKMQSFTGNQIYFDRSGMENGMYLYRVNAAGLGLLAGKLLVEQ